MDSGDQIELISQEASWLSKLQRTLADHGFKEVHAADGVNRPDLIAVWNGIRCVFDVKASRGRSRELKRALAAAVVEARHFAGASETPVGVVAVSRISPSMRAELKRYAATILGDAPWGLMDGNGGLGLHLPGAQINVAPRPSRRRNTAQPLEKQRSTFSDLDQWMLKMLLSVELAPPLQLCDVHGVTVDRPFESVSALARRSGVAGGTAHGLVRRLRQDGSCTRTGTLQLLDVPDLIQRWLSMPSNPTQMRARFVLPGPHFTDRFRTYCNTQRAHRSGRVCMGQFVAMEQWGLRHVVGAPPLVHAEFPDVAMRDLGLIEAGQGEHAEVIVRLPRFPESTFRGAVAREELTVADPIQCLLDIAGSSARGEEMMPLLHAHLFPGLAGMDG
ncbi:MAG: hypothetical protein ACI9WU_001568 [Myxococcota bacterium]|jgi:hypothetical protein